MVFIINYLELCNIQSYKRRIKFRLSSKLTIFSARNNTGKSAVRRSLTLFAKQLDQTKLRGFLNKDSEQGYVRLYLDGGYILEVTLTRILRKDKDDFIKLRYTYVREVDGVELNHWDDFSAEIPKILGWIRLETKDETIILNFKRSGNHLFVDTSGSMNTQALNSLCYNEEIERRLLNIGLAMQRCESTMVNIASDAKAIASKLKTCEQVDITYLQQLKDFYNALKENIELASSLRKIYTQKLEVEKLSFLLEIYEQAIVSIEAMNLKTIAEHQLDLNIEKHKLARLQQLITTKLLQKQLQKLVESTALVNVAKESSLHTSDFNNHLGERYYLKEIEENSTILQSSKTLNVILTKHMMKHSITKVAKAKSLRGMVLNVESRVSDILSQNQAKIYAKSVQKIKKLGSTERIIRATLQKATLKKIINQQLLVTNSTVISQYYNKLSYLQRNKVYLSTYLYSMQEKQELEMIMSKIPTCPTCGKVYMEGSELCRT